MRRLFVILALLAVMVGVKTLQAAPSGAIRDPLTLATIGFVLLAAFTLAEIGASLGLPRVTGYIVGGALLGPSVSSILAGPVVTEMQMFNTLALGLIATGAGLELDMRQIAKVWKTLASTVALKIVLFVVLIGGGLVAFETFSPSLGLSSVSESMGLGLVFAALAIGTSPAITLALLTESKAKGRAADIFLGTAVLKDLVVVVALAIAIALARPLVGAPSSAEHNALVAVAVELSSSILAGCALGGLLIAYLRFVKAEMLLFVAAMILVTSELGRALHLELLLVFITAGFIVKNFSRHEHELLHPVEMVALPVFVVFFTNAGAGIDLTLMLKLLPVALFLCALRVVGLYVASGIGAKLGGESPEIRRNAWLGYIPQAGVTLGLVGLAAQQLPQVATAIVGLGMAVVAINLLVGPLTLRIALSRTLGSSDESQPVETSSDALQPPTVVANAQSQPVEGASLDELLPHLQQQLSEPMLFAPIERLVRSLGQAEQQHHKQLLLAVERRMVSPLNNCLPTSLEPKELQRAERVLRAIAWVEADQVRDDNLATFRRAREALRSLPLEVAVELSLAKLACPDNAGVLRTLQWAARRMAYRVSKRASRRRVPLQMIVRVALELRVARWAAQQGDNYCRLNIRLMQVVRTLLRGRCSRQQARASIEQQVRAWSEQSQADWSTTLRVGLLEALESIASADLPGASSRATRLSRHDKQISERMDHLAAAPESWGRLLGALRAGLSLEFELHAAAVDFDALIDEWAQQPLLAVEKRLNEALSSVESALFQLGSPGALVSSEGEGQLLFWRKSVPKDSFDRLEDDAIRLRSAATLQRFGLALRGAAASLPERVEGIRTVSSPEEITDPLAARFRTLAPQSVAFEALVEGLLPQIEDQLQRASSAMGAALDTLQEIDAMTVHAISQSERAVFERAHALAVSCREAMGQEVQEVSERLGEQVQRVFATTISRLAEPTAAGVHEESVSVLDRVAIFVSGLGQRVVRLARRALSSVRDRVLELSNVDLARRLQGKLAAGPLDGASLVKRVAQFAQPPSVPPSYAKLFGAQAVREPRLFRAHQSQLSRLLSVERQRGADGSRLSILVLGDHGSGRSSLLNVAQFELSSPRVLRPQPSHRQRHRSLVRALALELGCEPTSKFVQAALATVPTTVLVDDLELWFEAGPNGVKELAAFLGMIRRGRTDTCFVAAMSTAAHESLKRITSLDATFGCCVPLGPLTAAQLREVVEGRHLLSGMELEYHSELGLHWLRKVRPDGEASLFFRLLRRRSEGNLALALRLYLSSIEGQGSAVRVRTERPLALGLAFVRQLHAVQLAALHQALRRGRVDVETLVGGRIRLAEVRTHLSLLTLSGLLTEAEIRPGQAFTIPPELRAGVEQALQAHRGEEQSRL